MISMLDSLETEQNKTKIADLQNIYIYIFFYCVIKYIGSFLLKQEDKSTTS